MIPLHRLKAINIDVAAEVRNIIESGGHDRGSGDDCGLGQVYRVYRNMKTLGFFQLVAEAYGNRECTGGFSQRVNDLFSAATVEGHIYFVTEITHEALEAFLDDGLVLYKIRPWLTDCFRKACALQPGHDLAARWDALFEAGGSPLPKGVKVLPFYHKELAPGCPGIILVLVYAK